MWSILKIYVGIGLLAIYVHGIRWDIQEIIKRRELIDGIFRPINESEISHGRFATVFKGVNMIDNSDVAMKFSYRHSESKHEYEMYSYLNAIDNPSIEKYGISPIYYYNQCGSVTLTVFSLFECDLYQKRFKSNVPFETIDYLILFRDFVRQSKYIHSRGIRHDDLKPKNIMLRKSRSFLIDFNISSKMNESTNGYTVEFASRKFHRYQAIEEQLEPEGLRIQLDDWESFLYTMASVCDVRLDWFDIRKRLGYSSHMLAMKAAPMKILTNQTINQIREDVKCEHLKAIMIEFANEAFKKDGSLPQYDYFDILITKKIEYMIGKDQPAVFSWLKGHERDEAIEDLMINPPATAEEIDDPKATYLATDYETPEYDYFEKRQYAMAKSAEGNYQRFLKEEDEKDLQKEYELIRLEAKNEKMKKKQLSASKKMVSKCLSCKYR